MFILKNHQTKIKWMFLLLAIIAGGAVVFLLHYTSPLSNLPGKVEEAVSNKVKNSLEVPNNIFPLAQGGAYEDCFPDFSGKLKVYANEPRPDAQNKTKNLEVALLSENKRKAVQGDEKFYLSYNNGYKFADGPTDLWFSVCHKQPNIAKVTVGSRYKDQNNNIRDIEKTFDLTVFEQEPSEQGLDDGFSSLKNAIFLGPDLCMELSARGDKSQCSRLILPSKEILFVKPGALFIFNESKWQIAENANTNGYSLFRISSLTQNNIDIEYWKKGEVGCKRVKLTKPAPGNALHVTDDFISDLCIRTKKQVSCKVQGQRMILTEKDFLYKKEGKWKKGIQSDIEKGEDISEFFLFDKLELSPFSKVFVGYLFNREKTQMAKVEKKIIRKPSDLSSDKRANLRLNRKRK